MLFVVLLSNVLAVFLQALSIKLGTVSGLNLAEACRAFLPKWMNRVLYLMVQTAIIATGFAEVSDRTLSRSAVVAGADHDTKVITAAMILNVMLPNHVLARDCLLFIAIVLPVVFLYPPERWRFFRLVKFLFMSLIVAVVVCFSFELHLIKDVSPADVFRGYLPSAGLVGRFAVHQACSIIGATLVPIHFTSARASCSPASATLTSRPVIYPPTARRPQPATTALATQGPTSPHSPPSATASTTRSPSSSSASSPLISSSARPSSSSAPSTSTAAIPS